MYIFQGRGTEVIQYTKPELFGDDDDVCQRTAKVINQLAGEYFPSGLTTLVS